MLALFPGSQEGIYTIHPKHMAVKKPAYFDDEYLNVEGETVSQPQERPNRMSYFHERIRLAELSRMFADRSPIAHINTTVRKYDEILEYDQQLEHFQHTLPSYFSVNGSCLDENPTGLPEEPSVTIQRLSINCLVYHARCMVHLPYFPRSAVDSEHTHSRKVCLSCAGSIVRMHKEIRAVHPSWIDSRLRGTHFLRSLVLAGVIFLLDICSGIEIRDLKSERPEILDAWSLIDGLHQSYSSVRQFFDFSTQMLRRYGVSDSIIAELSEQNKAYPEVAGAVSRSPSCDEFGGEHRQMASEPSTMAQHWQTLGADVSLEPMSSDSMLLGFDAIFM